MTTNSSVTTTVQAGVKTGRANGRREFLRRQFDGNVTRAQNKFDVVFGLVLPLVCFILDPVVFRGWHSVGILEKYQSFAYAVSGLEMWTLAMWLVLGRSAGAWRSAMGGIMLAGALFSATIGAVLLPFSLIGLLVLIGALGFTPLFTAFVFLRNGLRAVSLANAEPQHRTSAVAALALGVAFALGVPAAAEWGISQMVSQSLADAMEDKEISWPTMQGLRFTSLLTDDVSEPIVWAYQVETEPVRRARLAKMYNDVTGRAIEARLEAGFLFD